MNDSASPPQISAPPVPAAPPTTPGLIHTPRRNSAWPEILGSAALVFGGFGIVISLWSLAVRLIWGDKFYRGAMVGEKTIALVKKYQPFMDVYTVAFTLTAIGLIYIGVLFIKRRKAARTWALWWSPLKLCVAGVTVGMGIILGESSMNEMIQSGVIKGPAGAAMQIGRYSQYLTQGISFLWYCAMPIFFLCFLNQRYVKETTSEWK